jgi:hypothetical protein
MTDEEFRERMRKAVMYDPREGDELRLGASETRIGWRNVKQKI